MPGEGRPAAAARSVICSASCMEWQYCMIIELSSPSLRTRSASHHACYVDMSASCVGTNLSLLHCS